MTVCEASSHEALLPGHLGGGSQELSIEKKKTCVVRRESPRQSKHSQSLVATPLCPCHMSPRSWGQSAWPIFSFRFLIRSSETIPFPGSALYLRNADTGI